MKIRVYSRVLKRGQTDSMTDTPNSILYKSVKKENVVFVYFSFNFSLYFIHLFTS